MTKFHCEFNHSTIGSEVGDPVTIHSFQAVTKEDLKAFARNPKVLDSYLVVIRVISKVLLLANLLSTVSTVNCPGSGTIHVRPYVN